MDFFNTDVLLKSFFEPFIFEKIAANTKDPENVFKPEVKKSDIYLGLFGKEYGYEDRNGISPTEMEYETAKGLAEPIFTSHKTFKLTIWRSVMISSEANNKEQVREQVRGQVREIILILNDEQSASEIIKSLNLKARRNFLQNYLQPAIEAGYIEMTQPKSPKSPTQKYRLTDKGKRLRKEQDVS